MESEGEEKQGVLKTVSKPGECVSIDQTKSRTRGFKGMMRGFLTKQRYTCATVFVDRYSDFIYIHLQRSISMIDMLEAKNTFEEVCRRYGIIVLHYTTLTTASFPTKTSSRTSSTANKKYFCVALTRITKIEKSKNVFVTYKMVTEPFFCILVQDGQQYPQFTSGIAPYTM